MSTAERHGRLAVSMPTLSFQQSLHAGDVHWAAAPSLDSSCILLAVFSFSSRISLNFLMFSKKSGLLLSVMKSLAFLLSPLLFEA